MANLVYILSAGHSGSTLLDMVIGSLPGVFSLGECTYLPWQIYRDGSVCELGQDFCSCGRKFSECTVWKNVISALSMKCGYDIFLSPYRFKIAILMHPTYKGSPTIFQRVLRSYYTRMLYTYGGITFPDITRVINTLILRKVVANNWLLFDTIGERLSINYVVDSSKDPVRLHLLRSHRPSSTRVILLVRHPFGIAASAIKRKIDPIEEVMSWIKYYRMVMGAAGKAFAQAGLITYESLASDPEGIREKITGFLGLSCPPGRLTKIDTTKYHLVAGNPMRYKREVEIRPDESWKHLLASSLLDKIEGMASGVIGELAKTRGVVVLSR